MEIRSLTGLRGIAAWVIVLFHFRGQSSILSEGYFGSLLDFGYLAVDLFFILSGFVIFINYSAGIFPLTKSKLLDFYGRRLARIYPLHIFVLLLYLINPIAIFLFSAQGDVGGRYDPLSFIYSLFLIQNWGFTSELSWNIPAWSISVEFAAYLVFPWFVLLLNRIACFKFFFAGAGVVLLLAFLPLVYLVLESPSLGAQITSLGIIRCIVQFSIGCFLGFFYVACKSELLALGGAVFLLCIATAFLLYWAGFRFDFLLIPISFFGLIVYLLEPSRWASRILSFRYFNYLGLISYSTYMIHYFVKDWINFLSSYLASWDLILYVFVTFFSSVALYHLVEINGKRKFFVVWERIFRH